MATPDYLLVSSSEALGLLTIYPPAYPGISKSFIVKTMEPRLQRSSNSERFTSVSVSNEISNHVFFPGYGCGLYMLIHFQQSLAVSRRCRGGMKSSSLEQTMCFRSRWEGNTSTGFGEMSIPSYGSNEKGVGVSHTRFIRIGL